ncbi:MAG: hypothetical protein KGJ02_03995 [Verrucomicrobiota bacterium]|nr:hypothetical protein [Verrucomicrobiota bacterium]
MKKLYFILILSGALLAEEATHLRYVKVGNEMGAGYRYHVKSQGFDLSLNYAPLFGQESWTSGKALYLTYPFYNSQTYFYAGAGAGFLHHTFDRSDKTFPTGELLIGYEFFPEAHEKIFVQVGASIPLTSDLASPFSALDPAKERWKPTVTLGFGF